MLPMAKSVEIILEVLETALMSVRAKNAMLEL
jgi:hypothetical protein